MAGDELVPRPARGRTFGATARVRLADISRSGRLRLDAIARLLQDVSSDDAVDAGQGPDRGWVVRRLVLELGDDRAARLRDELTLVTWCSGVGPRWAERRTDIDLGVTTLVRAAALWVYVDLATGRPMALDADFDSAYGEAAAGRRVGQRLRHPAPPTDAGRAPWPVRVTDFDVLGHVTNAAYWQPVEETLATLVPRRRVVRAELEFRSGIDPGEPVELVRVDGDDELDLWLMVGDEVRASVVVDLAPTERAARPF